MPSFDRRRRRPLALTVALVALAAVIAACGDDDATTSSSPGGAGGSVVISGSSTVAPISALVAEDFEDANPGASVTVDGPGTGDGFELFCAGETDISDASRPIKAEEAAACEEAGIGYIELKIAFDGMAVMTNPRNTAVECLTLADLYALAGPESQGFRRWSDARALAAELGSDTELPDLDLSMIAPGEESGTYDSFIEIVLAPVAKERVGAGVITEDEASQTRPDYQASGDDNVIIQGIGGAGGSFGWVGFAFAHEAGDAIKVLEIDGGDGCVMPTPESIADGTYPVSRALYIYVSTEAAARNATVTAFVDHYLGEGIGAVEEAGYVRLPDDQLVETRAAWAAR